MTVADSISTGTKAAPVVCRGAILDRGAAGQRGWNGPSDDGGEIVKPHRAVSSPPPPIVLLTTRSLPGRRRRSRTAVAVLQESDRRRGVRTRRGRRTTEPSDRETCRNPVKERLHVGVGFVRLGDVGQWYVAVTGAEQPRDQEDEPVYTGEPADGDEYLLDSARHVWNQDREAAVFG